MSHDPAETDDDLTAKLAALPIVDIDPLRAASHRRQARVAFVEERDRRHARAAAGTPRAPGLRARAVYRQVLEPALVAVTCAAYMLWALSEVMGVLGPRA